MRAQARVQVRWGSWGLGEGLGEPLGVEAALATTIYRAFTTREATCGGGRERRGEGGAFVRGAAWPSDLLCYWLCVCIERTL